MSVLIRNGTAKWEKAQKTEFSEETQLQRLLYESPELVEWEDDEPLVFTRESSLPGAGYTDLIGVAGNGDILLVETKLAKNPEIRRKVIGQILEYAAFLWGMNYDDFNEMFAKREGKSLGELMADKAGDLDTDEFHTSVAQNLKDGRFSLLIAVDEMNEELEKVLAYLSTRGGGLKLEALAVRVFTSGSTSILVPQRYGQLNQPSVFPESSPKKLTVEQVVERSPDERTRELMELTISGWRSLGHLVDPGTAGLSFKAEIGGEVQPFFWADPSPSWGIQPLFGGIQRRGAPADRVTRYRQEVSKLRGFPGDRCLTGKRPPAPFPLLDAETINRFLQLTNEVVLGWRSAASSRS